MIWRLKNALGEEETWYRKAVIDKIKENCEDNIKQNQDSCGLAKHILDFLKKVENGIFKKEK